MFGSLFRRGRSDLEVSGAKPRQRLRFDALPAAIYAIGDIHGCLTELKRLEAKIVSDAACFPGEKWLVYLGDLIDRGPDSASVISHVMSPATGEFRKICLLGNHEWLFLDFICNPSARHEWLHFGGVETLASYGLFEISQSNATLRWQIGRHLPEDHLEFLKQMPILLEIPGYCFVHAGMKDGVPLALQQDKDLIWTRPAALVANSKPFTLVHGHSPVAKVDMSNNRINIDTGAYQSGILSAVKIRKGQEPEIIASD